MIRQTPPDAFAYGDIGVLLGRAIGAAPCARGDYVLGRKPSGHRHRSRMPQHPTLSGSTVFARDVRFLCKICLSSLSQTKSRICPPAVWRSGIAQLRARWEEDSPCRPVSPGLPSPGYDDLAQPGGPPG